MNNLIVMLGLLKVLENVVVNLLEFLKSRSLSPSAIRSVTRNKTEDVEFLTCDSWSKKWRCKSCLEGIAEKVLLGRRVWWRRGFGRQSDEIETSSEGDSANEEESVEDEGSENESSEEKSSTGEEDSDEDVPSFAHNTRKKLTSDKLLINF